MSTAQPLPAVAMQVAPAEAHSATARHIRGSSLLLVGKLLAQVMEFGAQVLLVRALSKADYGAFSYALSFALLCKGIAMFGLPDTLSRFIPLYREHRQHDRLLGALVLAFATVIGLGLLIAAGLNVGINVFDLKPTDDPAALSLLAIMAFLIPIEALDGLLTNLFAALASPRVIFFRQSVLGPGLRLALVVALTALQADVLFLTIGYLLISLLGVALYGVMFARTLRGQDWLAGLRLRALRYPAREIYGFAIPLLASVLVWLVIESSDALLLGYFHNTEAVASFRAVLPMARLNQGVILTFALLYTPLAARLYARRDHSGLADLYWQTALWMTVLSLPIFLLTFCFAGTMTVQVYGPRYADSVPIMALLSLGYFFHTVLGFNGLTLKVYGRLRFTVAVDVAATVVNVIVNLALIPPYGVLGAAVGSASTLIVHNLLKQYGLWRYTGISLFRRQYALVYGMAALVALALLGLQIAILPESLPLALALGAAGSLVVLAVSWRALAVGQMFPELGRWPLVRSARRVFTRVG